MSARELKTACTWPLAEFQVKLEFSIQERGISDEL